jgi:DNA-directed RNA polymerase III subunit RPC2
MDPPDLFLDISLATGTEIYSHHTFVVNVNSTIIGLTRYPTRFVSNFRKLRRAGQFSEFVSVYINHHHRAVHIASDGGRICRPMIIVEGGRSRIVSDHISVSSVFTCTSPHVGSLIRPYSSLRQVV